MFTFIDFKWKICVFFIRKMKLISWLSILLIKEKKKMLFNKKKRKERKNIEKKRRNSWNHLEITHVAARLLLP